MAGRSSSGARREEQAPDGQPTLGNVRNLAYLALTENRQIFQKKPDMWDALRV